MTPTPVGLGEDDAGRWEVDIHISIMGDTIASIERRLTVRQRSLDTRTTREQAFR